jgi:hypothetical protein
MKIFKTIITSFQAEMDIKNVTDYIRDIYGSNMTATNYKKGLYKMIDRLSSVASIRAVNPYVQSMFGVNARHIIYKKMTIIYYIEDDCVYVERVIASSLIH